MTLSEWLRGHRLEHLAGLLSDARVDLDVLGSVSDDELREIGVALGDRKRLRMALDAGSPMAERRALTILFADLVDFTALSSAIDPEILREVTQAYHAACARAVGRFDGTIAQYLGDGVLAYFGYPRAHEDDAERAVLAALELSRHVAALRAPGGAALAARVGVASGLVVVGDVARGELVSGRNAVGETPNVAARLQALGAPGDVIVGPSTRRLIGNRFLLEELPEVQLKGLARPFRPFRALGTRARTSRFEATRGPGEATFVGRDDALATLARAWASACDGKGRVVVLEGEPGVGKSRLCVAFRGRLGEPGRRWVLLQCSPHHGATMLHPVIEFIRQALDARASGVADERRALGDWLARDLGRTGDALLRAESIVGALLGTPGIPAPALPPAQLRQQTRDALCELLVEAASIDPLLLVVEDAHWIDPTTAELLAAIAARVPEKRILLLITRRQQPAPPFREPVSSERITLERLDVDDAQTLLTRTPGADRIPEAMRQKILEKAEGIPLFIEELALSVSDASREPGAETSEAAVPDTLQASLLARFDHLGAARAILQVGSAIGRIFHRPMLAATLGWDAPTLASALRTAVESGLIRQRGDGGFEFKHALVQDAAYSTLLLARRRRLHASIAASLEHSAPALVAEQPELLARHLAAAGETDRAIAQWEHAGRQLAARGAGHEAIQHFESALALVREKRDQAGAAAAVVDRLELQLLLALGSVVMMARGNGSDQTVETFERARELARRVGTGAERFVTAFSLWFAYENSRRIDATQQMLHEIDALADEAADGRYLVQACHARWTTALTRGDFRACLASADRGLRAFDASDRSFHLQSFAGHDPQVCALAHRSNALTLLGDQVGAYRAADAAMAILAESPHLPSRIIAAFAASGTYWAAGDPERIRPIVNPLIELCTRAGIAYYGAVLSLFGGWADAATKRDPANVDAMRDALAVFLATGSRLRVSLYETLIAQACLCTGRLHEGLEHVRRGQAGLASGHEDGWRPSTMVTEGDLLLALGEARAAEVAYREALAVSRDLGTLLYELRAALGLARLVAAGAIDVDVPGLLGPICTRFPEDARYPDLSAARRLLAARRGG